MSRISLLPRERGEVCRGDRQLRPRGSNASRNPSPTKLIASTAMVSVRPGAIARSGSVSVVRARRVQHVAPGRRLRADAEAEEGEGRLGQHVVGDVERRRDDDRRDHVRQQVAP